LDRSVLETSLLEEYGSATEGCEIQAELVIRELKSARVRRPSTVHPSWPAEPQIRRQSSLTDAITNWSLNPFHEGVENLVQYVFQMFRVFNLMERFNISEEKLKALILAIQEQYRPNPFHNFEHAFSVTHMTFLILNEGAIKYLGSLEVLAALIAALCHDLDHPGHTNAYEVASTSKLALLFCDDSVLERHHAHVAYQLFNRPECDILEHMTPDESKDFRRIVFEAVLQTDMGFHFEHMSFLDSHSELPINREDSVQRRHFVSAIVHCADLSGQVFGMSNSHIV